jgi:hypothetical protein
MIANKTLLSGTLMVTFVSGTFVGHVGTQSSQPDLPRRSVENVYHAEFDAARERGYSAEEIERMRVIYKDYLKSYRVWWDAMLESHQTVTDPIDLRFRERIADLERSFGTRTGK